MLPLRQKETGRLLADTVKRQAALHGIAPGRVNFLQVDSTNTNSGHKNGAIGPYPRIGPGEKRDCRSCRRGTPHRGGSGAVAFGAARLRGPAGDCVRGDHADVWEQLKAFSQAADVAHVFAEPGRFPKLQRFLRRHYSFLPVGNAYCERLVKRMKSLEVPGWRCSAFVRGSSPLSG